MSEELTDKLKKYFSEEELVDIIRGMVRIPSYRGVENQETGVACFIQEFFRKEGIEAEVTPVVDGRCNVVARLRGKGEGKTLLLTGHMDTVPPYDMQGNPFEVTINNGRMHGRGVVDMKGSLACMMMAVAAVKRAGIELQGDLVFAGVIDEEDKSEGTRALIKQGFSADAAIVGEPTEMDINIGHRGLEWFEFTFHGKTVHGGKQKEGINAISKAARFISRVEEKLIPRIESRVHPISGSSSMNYGYIKGGTQPSTVAGECMMQIDRRWVPGEKFEDIVKEYQDILDELHAEDPQFNADFKVMDISFMEEGYIHEALEIDPGHALVKATGDSVFSVLKREAKLKSFTAWTDGGLLSSYGKIPTIVFGPGNLESAHSAGEYLDVAEVVPATLIYAMTAVKICSSSK